MEPPKYLGDPNPALSFTFHFQDGALMSWRFDKPWDQVDMFSEIGRLGAKYELGIAIGLPPQDQSHRDLQNAHDCLWAFVMGEHPETENLPEDVRLEMEPVKAAIAALDALCWMLRHEHNTRFQENLEKLGWREMEHAPEEDDEFGGAIWPPAAADEEEGGEQSD